MISWVFGFKMSERDKNQPTLEETKEFTSILDKEQYESTDDMIRAVELSSYERHVELKEGQNELKEVQSRIHTDMRYLNEAMGRLAVSVQSIKQMITDKETRGRKSPSLSSLVREETPSRFVNRLEEEPSDSSGSESDESRSKNRSGSVSSDSSSTKESSILSRDRRSKSDATKRKEEQRRRETIFSKPEKTEKKREIQKSSNVLILKSITREQFPAIEFKSLNLEHICIFLDEYDRILERHPDQGLRMIDFVNPRLHARLTIAATDLNYVTASTFGLGVTNLTDKQLKKCILHMVRAISAEDFIKKIKSVQFPSPETDRASFSPSALTFSVLFDRATLYAHRFNRILQMVAKRANGEDIPPLYKEGKTLGIIDYFLAAWPNDAGNNLYSKLSINHNTLRHMKTFTEFTYHFFKVLKPYKKLRESVDDLDSLLSVKKRNDSDRPSMGQPKNDKGKRFSKVHNIKEDVSIEEVYEELPSEIEEVSNPMNEDFETENKSDMNEDATPVVRFEEEEETHELTALEVQKSGQSANYPCWFNYKFGKCTKMGCKLDHSREAMTKYQDTRLQELIKSSYADPENVFMQKVQRFYKSRGIRSDALKPKA